MNRCIAVLGGGTMGYGIALDFARFGNKVHLLDINDEALNRSIDAIKRSLQVFWEEELIKKEDMDVILANISTYTDMGECVKDTDIVIEALPEKMELKQKIFHQVDSLCPEHTILITNTSSLRISEVFSTVRTERKSRCLTAHYFNPAEIVPLVELLGLPETSPEIMDEIRAMYKEQERYAITVKKEIPGLVVNRLQWAIRRELLWQWENGIADVKDLDMAIFFGPGIRWATMGFLTAIDMGGLDIACATGTNLLKDMDVSQTVVPKMLALRDAGHLGLKTGKGFFEYAEEDRKNIKDAYVRRLVRQLGMMHDHLKTMKV